KIDETVRELAKKAESTSKSNSSNAITTTQATNTESNAASDDRLFDNAVKNNIVNTFTVDNEENELLDTLTRDIQNALNDYLPKLSKMCRCYMMQHLHEYHFNQDGKFTQRLTTGDLYNFKHDLNGLLMAVRAYVRADEGDREEVENFLENYPEYKDKPGFWKKTLIYSAAGNNHLSLVKYLVETAGCSVDAQNQHEIACNKIADGDATENSRDNQGYEPDQIGGSTALHVACNNNYLDIVKYLIDKGANYFITNESGKTPIDNSDGNQAIRDFFKNYLVYSYSGLSDASIPRKTVLDCPDRRSTNCVWEYKPVKKDKWTAFNVIDHNILCTSLKPRANDPPFNTTTYLHARESTYTVQLLTFLRGAKNQESNPSDEDGLAWIRCRGSSIANFDIHCVWQLMFLKYDTKKESEKASSELPSLVAETIPSFDNGRFQIKLNGWYTCDLKRNDLLDDAMNYRRRYVDIDCNYDIHYNENATVKCDLYEFTFKNNNETIKGCIRWIPKVIANTANTQNIIKILDNFKIINNFNPILLTTKRCDQVIGSKTTTEGSIIVNEDDENEENNPNDDMNLGEDWADDDENSKDATPPVINPSTWKIEDLLSTDMPRTNEQLPLKTEEDSIPDISIPISDRIINKQIDQFKREQLIINQVSEPKDSAKQNDAMGKDLETIKLENEQLNTKIILLQKELEEKAKNLKDNDVKSATELDAIRIKLEDLEEQLKTKIDKEKFINKETEQISTLQYTIPKSSQSVRSKFNIIINTLRSLDYSLKEYFKDNIPVIDLDDEDNRKITLKGFPIHHKILKEILEKWKNLVQKIQSVQEDYCQEINEKIKDLLKTIHQVHSTNPTYWKSYAKCLVKLVDQKYDSDVQKFKNFMNDKMKILLDMCIQNVQQDFQQQISDWKKEYMGAEKFSDDVELLKANAQNEFIHKYIFLQQKSTKTIPTKESARELDKHIETIKDRSKRNPDYKGYKLKHFQMIVSLLHHLMIFYHCFLIQLPLFNASFDLLSKIANNTVITIETATGSGNNIYLKSLVDATSMT
ncbi:unnamed protein product, partial [Rotaria sp. Silwood2]